MAATIKDVARLAGVASSTVSRTCSDHPSISPQTKEKVRKAMKELGYVPNFSASNLAARLSHTIGIILLDSKNDVYENPFFLTAIRGICQRCNERQYLASLITGENEAELLECIKNMVKSSRADGYIMMYSKLEDPVFDYLSAQELPFAVIGKSYKNVNQTVYVDNDNLLAGEEATSYLIGLGHQKIAYLGGDYNQIVTMDRYKGYLAALQAHQLSYNPDYCISNADLSSDMLGDHIRQMFLLDAPPTAIVVSDDVLAASLEKTLAELNISVPGQLSIIAFNNSLFARLTHPQLTSVDINTFQLGIEAAAQLIRRIEQPGKMATKTLVPHRIIERESCRKFT